MKKPAGSLFKSVLYTVWPAAFIILLLFGCAKKEVLRGPPLEPLPPVITSNDLIKRMDFSHIRTVKASVKAKLIYKGESMGTYSGVFLFENPGRLKLKFFGPFGITTVESLFDNSTLQILIPSEDILYEGALPFKNLLPDIKSLQDGRISLNEVEGLYALHIYEEGNQNPSIRESYYFETESLRLKRIVILSEEDGHVTISINGLNKGFPSWMDVATDEITVQLRLKDIMINEGITDEVFIPLSAQRQLPLSLFFRKD